MENILRPFLLPYDVQTKKYWYFDFLKEKYQKIIENHWFFDEKLIFWWNFCAPQYPAMALFVDKNEFVNMVKKGGYWGYCFHHITNILILLALAKGGRLPNLWPNLFLLASVPSLPPTERVLRPCRGYWVLYRFFFLVPQ